MGYLANIFPFFFSNSGSLIFLHFLVPFLFFFRCRTAAKRDSAEFRCFLFVVVAIERNLIDCTNYNNLMFLLNVFFFFRSHHPPFFYVRVLGGLVRTHTGRGMERLWAKELPAEQQPDDVQGVVNQFIKT